MRHPVSFASAAVFLFVITGVALWFHTAGTTPALADFIAPIVEAKTARFKLTFEMPGEPPFKAEVLFLAPCRTRTEQAAWSNEPKMITIEDREAGKYLTLIPGKKLATLQMAINKPRGTQPKNLFSEMWSLLFDARNSSDFKREPLGEKKIDGRPGVGYRLTGRGQIINLWGDPKTGLPIRIVFRMLESSGESTATLSDFVFNVDLDESLFSLEPPPGYRTQTITFDDSPAEEKDLIETFRHYSQLSGGAFPKVLDISTAQSLFNKRWIASHPQAQRNGPAGERQSPEEKQERMNELMKLTKGLRFVSAQLPPDADAHYAGKGVKRGAVDTPVFWYRPKDAKKYRVIYADLSIRESNTPPQVPNAEAVLAPLSPAK